MPVLFAICALMFVAPVQAGIVIVNHDEWTPATGTCAAQFGANIPNYFAGGPGGNFLICSNNFGLNNSTLINAITDAGHTVTANTGVTFDLPTLSAHTGIFLGGYVGGFNASVLTSYVNNGGTFTLREERGQLSARTRFGTPS